MPARVVSTSRPSPPLTVSTLPLGAMIRPSGVLSLPPEVTTEPVPALWLRNTAFLIRVIRFEALSATKRVPRALRPTPVGPTTSAAGSVLSANPEPITVWRISSGGLLPRSFSTRRSTVPLWTTFGLAATVPLRTLVTNSAATEPLLMAVMSQGPLMPWPDRVSTGWPQLLTTIRHPAFAVADMPFVVGRLPTTTQPPGRMSSAVVRPTPPGHGPGRLDFLMCANTVRWPPGVICTIVVPVPCKFLELLKLLTRTLPWRSLPSLWRTTATPYGLTSPLCGTVEAI